MLAADELRRVAAQFGVDDYQVRRDHLVSHLLAAIASVAGADVVFFGGTALARTHLPDGRLSEDVDLIALDRRHPVAERLTDSVPQALRREFPNLTWDRALTAGADTDASMLRSPDGLAVRVQLLSHVAYPPWPTENVELAQRYSDAPAAGLSVLTSAAFVAAKTIAWQDRAAPRDLWDLWALAEQGLVTADAADLYAKFGPTSRRPDPDGLGVPPDDERWRRDLSGQTRLTVRAAEAMATVRKAWRPLAP